MGGATVDELKYEAKLTKVGNSARVIVPKIVKENLNLEYGDKVLIIIRKVEQ